MKRREFIAALAATPVIPTRTDEQDRPAAKAAAARPLTITLLGTGTPAPSLTRQSSGYLIEAGNDLIVWDHGPGAHQRLIESGHRSIDTTHAFFTHLHYDHCMQYGRLVDSLLQERSAYYVHGIFDGLRGVSVASRANKPIGDRMIMNAAFLVSRDKEQEFDAAVKAIGGRYPHLTFKYTGPWPPYNFVNIRLKLERAENAG